MNPNNTQSKNTLRVVLEKKEDQHTNKFLRRFTTSSIIISREYHLSRFASIDRLIFGPQTLALLRLRHHVHAPHRSWRLEEEEENAGVVRARRRRFRRRRVVVVRDWISSTKNSSKRTIRRGRRGTTTKERRASLGECRDHEGEVRENSRPRALGRARRGIYDDARCLRLRA